MSTAVSGPSQNSMMNHCDHTHSVIFYIDDTDRSDLHRITDNTVYFMFQRSMWTQSSEMSTSTGTVIVHTTDMLCSSIGRHHFLVYSVRHHGVIIRCRVGTVPKVTNDVICRNPITWNPYWTWLCIIIFNLFGKFQYSTWIPFLFSTRERDCILKCMLVMKWFEGVR